ncbi:hypothetical protein [Mycolicibacterium mengxianglii]|uniref:hypothetical protein n=1 Tax=Mycolicibacterium mengxianglii TaxID=2736649 RepID=UPI0018D1E58F|nr:hypothetical protein [Mycolicibacterium mengxianglii]
MTAEVYVGGTFRPSAAVPVLEAATGERLGEGASASLADIDDAVAAARSALPRWPKPAGWGASWGRKVWRPTAR